MRSTASAAEIRPRSRAARAAQKYMPMLVGEVYSDRVDGRSEPRMLSAGREVSGSTIATNDRQVSAA
jgi:hypothetical protein